MGIQQGVGVNVSTLLVHARFSPRVLLNKEMKLTVTPHACSAVCSTIQYTSIVLLEIDREKTNRESRMPDWSGLVGMAENKNGAYKKHFL